MILGVFATIFVAIILFFVSCPIVNDISAEDLVKNIESIPLPENTQVVEKLSRAGKLVGNGNGMQFFGVVLLESKLPLEELEEYYSSYRKTQWDYIVEIQKTPYIDIIENGSLSFKTDMSNEKRYYIVYSWGNGISPFRDFDLRGN
ncbi:MAG: hypothetical protein J1D87_01960 [Lachnospiraceae bacterium]|nr:hypothetical protein [Lachnospiraceae bacterium]